MKTSKIFDFETFNQDTFAKIFVESHYDPTDWLEYRDDEKCTIEAIQRWTKRNQPHDIMFIIEFISPDRWDDELLKKWMTDEDFRDAMYFNDCPRDIYLGGIDSYKMIILPSY